MTVVRVNEIAFACGVPESGKSQLMRDVFLSRAPRVLAFDATGETIEKYPDAIAAYGAAEVRAALRACVDYREWTIAAALDPRDIPDIFALLVPPVGSKAPGYSRAIGGMAVYCDEAYLVAPVSYVDPAVGNAFRMGRHHRLSLYMAAQRAHECGRIVTATARHVIAFQQGEPADVDYLAKAISRPIAQLVPQLPKYHHVWFERTTGRVYLRNERRETYRVLSTWGNDIAPTLSLNLENSPDAR